MADETPTPAPWLEIADPPPAPGTRAVRAILHGPAGTQYPMWWSKDVEGFRALFAEVDALRSRLTEVERERDDRAFSANEADLDRIYVQRLLTGALVERDEAQAERDRMLPVVEAAKAMATKYRLRVITRIGVSQPEQDLLAAVDLYSSTVHPPTPETPNGH